MGKQWCNIYYIYINIFKNGQLGLGDYFTRLNPTLMTIPLSMNVIQISSGYYHLLTILNDSRVWGCGYNGVNYYYYYKSI